MESGKCLILKVEDVACILTGNGFRAQFFASQPNHHDLSPEVRVTGQVVNGADGNDGCRRIDGYATAIMVAEGNHIIHMGVKRQEFVFDPTDQVIGHTRHTLHTHADAQHVFGANRTIGIAVTFKSITFQFFKCWLVEWLITDFI